MQGCAWRSVIGFGLGESVSDSLILSLVSLSPRWAAPEVLDDYKSAAAGGKRVQASRRTRFATFPPYLTVVVKR